MVIFESDALWLKNPLVLFKKAFNDSSHDITIPRNYKETNGQKFAFDPMIIRPTYMSKQILKEIKERVRNNTKIMDQVCFLERENKQSAANPANILSLNRKNQIKIGFLSGSRHSKNNFSKFRIYSTRSAQKEI